MAISRVPGYSLLSNLDRQGTDLSITSAGQTLIKFDVTNYRVGINSTNPSEALEVVGNLLITDGNLLSGGNLTYSLGSATNWWSTIYVANIAASNFAAEYISGTLTTNAQPNITSVGNLTSLNASGNIETTGTVQADSGLVGTLLTNAQPNITSVGNLTALSASGNIETTGVVQADGGLLGTLLTSTQPNVTSVGTLTELTVDGNLTVNQQILPSGNLVGSLGNANLWWNNLYANTINSQGIYGTILTGDQYNITNLGNVTVQSISVGGNILITGNTSGGVINADELYEANNRVLTEATTITVTGDVAGAGTYSNVPLTLANSGITAGTYGSNLTVAQVTFDNKGRATSASNVTLTRVGNVSVNDTTITAVVGDLQLGSNVADLTVSDLITANVVSANELYDSTYRVVTENSNVQISGDVVGYGTYANINVELTDTGVTAGIYGSADDEYTDSIPKITVDSKGRITNIANVTLTQVGNVTFTDTVISTVANLTLAPANGYILANNSVISDVADPVLAQDAVTLNYLNTQLSSAANVLSIDDSTLSLNDDGVNPGELELILDGNVVANITAADANIYSANLHLADFTLSGNTISANGNIVIDARNSGVVQIAGTDAIWVPSGNSATRPLDAEEGYVRYNTDINLLEFYDGNTWTYPGAATISSDTITPDGTSDTYTLSTSTNSADGLLVSINGTLQRPEIAYTVVGNQITFIEVPQSTDIIEVRYMAAGATTIKSLAFGTTKVELTTGNINITGNILPVANVTYDLGSDAYQWRDLWLSGNTIHIGGARISTTGGNVTFTPAGSETPIDLTADADPTLIVSGSTNVKVRNSSVNVTISNTDLASFDAAGLNVSGNVSATRFIGDGSQLTGLPAGYANTNVAAYLPSYSGEIQSLTTANTNMQGYVDSTVSANVTVLGNRIDAANTAITTANTNMQGYVNSTVSANVTVLGNRIDAANTAITTANTNMKGYVDGQVSNILDGTTFTGTVAIPTLTLTNALGINYGGTGSTSISEALNNLLPSGEVSGYVLKTAGAGSYYWSAETGGGGVVGTQITTSRTYYTATSGQTVYTGLTYTPGAGQLRVYINGVRQFDSAYTESNSSAFTLGTGVSAGTVVLAEIDAYTDYNVYANATYSTPVGTISASTVQDALAELDTEKAALTGAAFTGNVTTTGNVAITSALSSTSSTTGALVVSGGAGIGGNLYVGGNLQVAGNVTYFSSNDVVFSDAMIYLADNNTGDVLDTGFVGSFTDAVRYQHTGLVRDASDGTWKLFANVVPEPTTTVDFTNATYSNLRIGNLTSVGATLTGNLSAGNVSATNLTGTLATASQTNITSVGTLTGLTVSGAPVPNANVSVNLGSTSAWWSTFYANTHVGRTATFTGNITAGNVSATNLVGAITSSQVTTALGYTPYNGATNPNGYLTTAVTSLAGTANQITASASTGSVTLSLPQSINTTASVQFGSFGVGTAASGTTGEIRATNNITAYYSSDARFKENIRDIPNALDTVSAIGGKLFDWTDEYIETHGGLDNYFLTKESFGVVAQDVKQVFPEAVRTREDGYLAVDYERMCALAFQAIKELRQQVQELQDQLKDK